MSQVDFKRDPISFKVIQGWPQWGAQRTSGWVSDGRTDPKEKPKEPKGPHWEAHETKQMEMLAFRNRYQTLFFYSSNEHLEVDVDPQFIILDLGMVMLRQFC